MKHLMLDIETMSNHTSEALVLSLGALPFSLRREGPKFGTGQTFVLDTSPQLLTRHESKKTKEWWRKQTPEAQRHWIRPVATIHPSKLEPFLRNFIAEFCLVCDVELWANGDRFDIGNLENLMFSYDSDKEFDDVVPWRYNAVSDCRTLYRWTTKLRTMPQDLKFESHDPMEDCKKQIWRLWEVATDLMMDEGVAVPVPVPVPFPSPQVLTPEMTISTGLPPIPANVTWDPFHANFYDSINHVGMGERFYQEWKDRAHEFPQTPKVVVHQ